MSTPLLLGTDWLLSEKCHLDFKSRYIWFSDGYTVSIRTFQSSNPTHSIAITTIDRQFPLYVKEVNLDFEKAKQILNEFDEVGANSMKHSELQQTEFSDDKLEHLSTDRRKEFKQLLIKFRELFASNNMRPGVARKVQHYIDTGNASPIAQAPYRMNP